MKSIVRNCLVYMSIINQIVIVSQIKYILEKKIKKKSITYYLYMWKIDFSFSARQNKIIYSNIYLSNYLISFYM